jgi:small subunit ribosomal protein S16
MSVVIRLMRAGAKKRPFYRMVAADSRRQRDGRFLEILGHYNPLAQPYELVVHKDKVERWLLRGAQPSEQAASLLRSLGISARQVTAAAAAAVAATTAAPAPAAEVKAAKQAKKAEKQAAKKAAGKSTRRPKRAVSSRKVEKKAARKTAKKSGVRTKAAAKS